MMEQSGEEIQEEQQILTNEGQNSPSSSDNIKKKRARTKTSVRYVFGRCDQIQLKDT